jgi:hypothetical protein
MYTDATKTCGDCDVIAGLVLTNSSSEPDGCRDTIWRWVARPTDVENGGRDRQRPKG